MILEAFQGAIARNADALLIFGIGWFVLMSLLAISSIGNVLYRRRHHGHQPSSAGGAPTTGIPSGGSSASRERPEPPRSGSGVTPPSNGLQGFPSRYSDGVDRLARIARLRAELENLVYAAQGGNADRDNPAMLKWFAERCVHEYGEKPNVDFVQALRTRAGMLEDALINARRTLEATKP